jgi:hypothetical protein
MKCLELRHIVTRPVGHGMIRLGHIDDHLHAPWVNRSPNLVSNNHTVPYGTDPHIAAFQAFHARLPSIVPPGQKSRSTNLFSQQPARLDNLENI